jgi:hypothetical protein
MTSILSLGEASGGLIGLKSRPACASAAWLGPIRPKEVMNVAQSRASSRFMRYLHGKAIGAEF